MTPLRQFKDVPQDIIGKAEGKQSVGLNRFIWVMLMHISSLAMVSVLWPGPRSPPGTQLPQAAALV